MNVGLAPDRVATLGDEPLDGLGLSAGRHQATPLLLATVDRFTAPRDAPFGRAGHNAAGNPLSDWPTPLVQAPAVLSGEGRSCHQGDRPPLISAQRLFAVPSPRGLLHPAISVVCSLTRDDASRAEVNRPVFRAAGSCYRAPRVLIPSVAPPTGLRSEPRGRRWPRPRCSRMVSGGAYWVRALPAGSIASSCCQGSGGRPCRTRVAGSTLRADSGLSIAKWGLIHKLIRLVACVED